MSYKSYNNKKVGRSILVMDNDFFFEEHSAEKINLVTNYNMYSGYVMDNKLSISYGEILKNKEKDDLLATILFSDSYYKDKMPIQLLLDESGLDDLIDNLNILKKEIYKIKNGVKKPSDKVKIYF